MPEAEKLQSALEAVGAILRNSHFIYTSGKHGREYVNKDALYPHTELTSQLAEEMASVFRSDGIEAVIAPALGGIILSQWTAHHLSKMTGKEVVALYAEKSESGFVLKRGYDQLAKGKRALLLEDIVTTGGSIQKLIQTVLPITPHLIGLGILCNRGGIPDSEFAPVKKVHALFKLSLESWEASQCPLCRQGVPVDPRVGKRI